MATKLQYFHLNGLAESIRYILHYSGHKFEDVRYDLSSWPTGQEDVKDALPFGQIPLYSEGDRKLNQSLAIARYLASKTSLLPSDPWEQAVLDSAALNVYDFFAKVVVGFIRETDPVKKELVKKELLTEVADYYLSRFEEQLKVNKGFFGGKLTWADFILVGIIETTNLFLKSEIEKKYPTIVALTNYIRSLPGVKEYIATRKPYSV